MTVVFQGSDVQLWFAALAATLAAVRLGQAAAAGGGAEEGGILARSAAGQRRDAPDAADRLGLVIQQDAAGGGSDGNWTSLYCPTLDGLGAVGDGAHAVHEHVLENKIPERSALLACLLMEPGL